MSEKTADRYTRLMNGPGVRAGGLGSALSGGLILIALAGCGGDSSVFDRSVVHGTATIDGMPVQWGELYFKGQERPEVQELAQAWIEVREGRFESGGPQSQPELGPNIVVMTVYKGNPPPAASPGESEAAPAEEPRVQGYWRGSVSVESDTKLDLAIKSSEVTQTRPE